MLFEIAKRLGHRLAQNIGTRLTNHTREHTIADGTEPYSYSRFCRASATCRAAGHVSDRVSDCLSTMRRRRVECKRRAPGRISPVIRRRPSQLKPSHQSDSLSVERCVGSSPFVCAPRVSKLIAARYWKPHMWESWSNPQHHSRDGMHEPSKVVYRRRACMQIRPDITICPRASLCKVGPSSEGRDCIDGTWSPLPGFARASATRST